MTKEAAEDKSEGNRSRSRLIWSVIGILLAIGVGAVILALASTVRERPATEPAASQLPGLWTISTPEEQGMDSSKLEEMMAFIDKHDLDIRSIIVGRNGQIVFEEYTEPDGSERADVVHSVTKSVVSLLVGIALHEGYIDGLDTPVGELLPGYTIHDPDGRKARLTLEHLLTMTAGLDWPEHAVPYSEPENVVRQMWTDQDPVQFVLDRPMAHEPGQVFAYNSGASLLLGVIVEEVTGRDLSEYAHEVLFQPIGIERVSWPKGPKGYYNTFGGLRLKPRDMARLGNLMLNEGKWDGRPIVPAEWVNRSTKGHIPADDYYNYGYQWWILPDAQGYEANGLYGQLISVLPAADMVVVVTADIRSDALFNVGGLVQGFIRPAIMDLPQEPEQKSYDSFGFTFVYSGGFYLTERPLPGREAVSEAAGMVEITSNKGLYEMVSLLWSPAAGREDERALLDDYLAAIEESVEGLSPGDYGASEKNGRPMPYRYSELAIGEATLQAVSGLWICDEPERLFGATYATAAETTTEALLAEFENYVDGLSCH